MTTSIQSGRRAVSVSAGYWHTCALLDNNAVVCWGYNQYGQLGRGSREGVGTGLGQMGDNLKAVDLGKGEDLSL